MTLPRDYTRCMGQVPTCPVRDTCLRYLDRPKTGMVSWVRSLNEDPKKPCQYYIKCLAAAAARGEGHD
jgi:hypothetical protein